MEPIGYKIIVGFIAVLIGVDTWLTKRAFDAARDAINTAKEAVKEAREAKEIVCQHVGKIDVQATRLEYHEKNDRDHQAAIIKKLDYLTERIDKLKVTRTRRIES